MSEEKLYAVKNDRGKYWDFSDSTGFWSLVTSDHPTTRSKKWAEIVADNQGGHVVTLIGEPEKVVLSEEQAEIVEQARIVKDEHGYMRPAKYIAENAEDSYASERILMEAFVNGYTVAKDKKYNVKVPHVPLYYWKTPDGGLGIDDLNIATADDDPDDFEFTEAEIEHYGLQDCEKFEVTDDDD